MARCFTEHLRMVGKGEIGQARPPADGNPVPLRTGGNPRGQIDRGGGNPELDHTLDFDL